MPLVQAIVKAYRLRKISKRLSSSDLRSGFSAEDWFDASDRREQVLEERGASQPTQSRLTDILSGHKQNNQRGPAEEGSAVSESTCWASSVGRQSRDKQHG